MIYLDNHSTTRCDPRVVDAMLPWMSEQFGNPHSGHSFGRAAAEAVEVATDDLAVMLGAQPDAVVITSGATESNNLAIRGVCLHPRQKRRHLVTVTTEHPAVRDVTADLRREGFRITEVPVRPTQDDNAGMVDLQRLADAIDDDTALVSVMWANNEIGTIAPMGEIARICHDRGALLHSDATQAVGRLAVDVRRSDVDLLSASAHKFYGPKGTGLLIVGNSNRRVRLRPQIVGGGQQHGLRSGTMNPAGVIGMTAALRLCQQQPERESRRIGQLRNRLWEVLSAHIDDLQINGPPLSSENRLAGNLHVTLPEIEGEAWISAAPDVAFSSGSACSQVDPTPSHVVLSLGRTESEARRSVRFGVGRFNTEDEIDQAGRILVHAFERLRQLRG